MVVEWFRSGLQVWECSEWVVYTYVGPGHTPERHFKRPNLIAHVTIRISTPPQHLPQVNHSVGVQSRYLPGDRLTTH